MTLDKSSHLFKALFFHQEKEASGLTDAYSGLKLWSQVQQVKLTRGTCPTWPDIAIEQSLPAMVRWLRSSPCSSVRNWMFWAFDMKESRSFLENSLRWYLSLTQLDLCNPALPGLTGRGEEIWLLAQALFSPSCMILCHDWKTSSGASNPTFQGI